VIAVCVIVREDFWFRGRTGIVLNLDVRREIVLLNLDVRREIVLLNFDVMNRIVLLNLDHERKSIGLNLDGKEWPVDTTVVEFDNIRGATASVCVYLSYTLATEISFHCENPSEYRNYEVLSD
jgi:hypothetical protein